MHIEQVVLVDLRELQSILPFFLPAFLHTFFASVCDPKKFNSAALSFWLIFLVVKLDWIVMLGAGLQLNQHFKDFLLESLRIVRVCLV